MGPERAYVMPFAFLVVALTFGLPRANASELERVRIAHAERTGDRLILDVSTPGGAELPPEAFQVTVNSLRGEDVVASPKAAVEDSREIVLAVDTSGSMKGKPLAEAKRAVARFLATIEPQYRVALVGFASTTEVVAPPTTDRARVRRAVSTLDATGETAVFDGIVRAVRLGNPGGGARNVVVLSDGADTASSATLKEAVSAARARGATVSVVGIKSPEYAPRTLAPLVVNTGGALVETTDASELSRILEGFASKLATPYRIELTDPDPLASKTQIEVTVKVEGDRLQGARQFSLAVPAPADASRSREWGFELPLPVFLVGVFIAVGTLAFLAAEAVRKKKTSPADRIAWYDDPNAQELDTDALINAAVLQRAKKIATDLASRTGYLERIETEIDGAGMRWRPGEAIVATFLLAIVAGFLSFALSGVALALLGIFAGSLGPFLFVKRKASQRRKAFYRQLSDVLVLLTGGLRAGYSMQQAIGAAAEDALPPASEEFRRVMAEVRLGASLEDSLKAMAKRVKIVDFDWTVLAIEIQREVGGDLAEILDTIGETIRDRERLHGKVRTLTAEGRLSGLVLGGLPFFMAGLMFLRNRDYLEPLYTTTKGLWMVGGSLLMMVIGIVWMKKIVTIEV